jgi:DNA-binding beta-propeller fold protein YncE
VRKLCLVLLPCLVLSLQAQVLDASLTVSDGNAASADNTFGLLLDAPSSKLYVTLCGTLAPWTSPPSTWGGWNNNDVARIDLATFSQDGVAPVGLFPEDIAITRHPNGQARHLWVSNSTDGTVTRLNPDLSAPQAIMLTPRWGGNFASVYPFGIIASADSTRVYVSGTSCGNLDVIDADPASPNFSTVIATIAVPDMWGRPTWINSATLAIPFTTYNYDPVVGYASSSITGIKLVNVVTGNVTGTIATGSAVTWAYPSITDIVLTPAGKIIGTVGYGLAPEIVEFDPATLSISRSSLLPALTVGLGLHGITIDPQGKTLALTDMLGHQVVFVDVATLQVIGTAPTGNLSQPNEVQYSPDGSRLYVSLQGMPVVQKWRALPGHELSLSTPIVATAGQMATFALRNLEAGLNGYVFMSLGAGPTNIGVGTVALSWPFDLLFVASGNPVGHSETTFVVPQGLVGLTFYFQAATVDADGGLRISNPAQVTVF